MRFIKRCGDCGQEVGKQKYSTRANVCDVCWENRTWLVKNGMQLPPEVFKGIQRSMASKRGTAKRKIEALKREMGETLTEVKGDS